VDIGTSIIQHFNTFSYKLLAPLAQDPLTAPASQAFVESIFSLCGHADNRQTLPNLQITVTRIKIMVGELNWN